MKIADRQLLDRIGSARIRLCDKLVTLDIHSLGISAYNQRYLDSKLADIEGILKLYSRLLYLSLRDHRSPLDQFVLVDYGGGSGLISLLAAEAGVGTVIYNDIYNVSCTDAERLSDALELSLNHIVCGDVNELISYLQENRISIDAITSYDVLEHIYDVESHFNTLANLSNRPYRIVYASGANIANPRFLRTVRKQQLEAEYEERGKVWGHKERDSLQAYLRLRASMISAYAPDLSDKHVKQLARATRGLIQSDIEQCVDEFRRDGKISYHIDHPTNTCDPTNGNWCEHLMEPEWIQQILANAGFSAEISPGYYSISGPFLKRSVKVVLNAVIRLLGTRGMFIAPHYVVCADFTPRNR